MNHVLKIIGVFSIALIQICSAVIMFMSSTYISPYSDTVDSTITTVSEEVTSEVKVSKPVKEKCDKEDNATTTATTVPPTTIPTSAYSYTEEDLDLLSRLIFSESGTESYETQLKVGSVVMNRVDSPHFPNTIREVIYQKNQFSVTFIKKNGAPMIDQPADKDAKRAAYEVLTYGSVLPPDVQVFFRKSITTGWVATREPYGTFDHITFAYIYPKGEK